MDTRQIFPQSVRIRLELQHCDRQNSYCRTDAALTDHHHSLLLSSPIRPFIRLRKLPWGVGISHAQLSSACCGEIGSNRR